MESRNKDSLYENPCYSASTSQQGSHDKSEADCDIYESLDLKESTKQSPTLKNNEPTTRKNGKRFPYAVFCAIAVLVLISAVMVALALSISNAIKLQGTSNLTQQSQLTQNQLEEVKNDLLSAVQNLSVHFLTYKIAFQQTQNQSENASSILENTVQNLSNTFLAYKNAVDTDLNQLEETKNALSILENTVQNLSVHFLTYNSAVNTELSAIQTTIQLSILPEYSVPECGSGTWRRLVYLNMSDPSQRCPPAWREYTTPVRSCGRPETNTPLFASSVYNAHGTRYRNACGRVIGYQYGITEAFSNSPNSLTLDDPYVDGISVTHGNPRTHIWTFAAGQTDRATDIEACPCTSPSARAHVSPLFIGSNYFCESSTTSPPSFGTFYSDDPLWDGEGCANSQCECTFNSPPWFNVTLPNSTTDDIEVRICSNVASTTNEDTPIQSMEIYVQ